MDVIALAGCFNGNLPGKSSGAGYLRGRSDYISAVTHAAPAEMD